MVEDPLKLFVLEYSITQDATHVHTLGAAIEKNKQQLARGISSDFVPVGLFHSREEVDEANLAFRRLADEAQLVQGSSNWHHISEVLDSIFPPELNPQEAANSRNIDKDDLPPET